MRRNKPDSSVVQKSIRAGLSAARDDEVRSVFDLAIIIRDRCSRVFFDRTQSTDLQPQVMDAFANAIGKVVSNTSPGYIWTFTENRRLTSRRYHTTISGNVPASYQRDTILEIRSKLQQSINGKIHCSTSILKATCFVKTKISWMSYLSCHKSKCKKRLWQGPS